jgi:hypothetical protein
MPARDTEPDALSSLVTALVARVADAHPGVFMHRGVDLEGVMRRVLYFRALTQPSRMAALLAAHPAGRATLDADSTLTGAHEALRAQAGTPHLADRAAGTARAVRRLASSWTRAPRAPTPEPATCALFALNTRFVRFFEPLVGALGAGQCVFLSTDDDDVAPAVARTGARCARATVPPVRRWPALPLTHPLCNDLLYAIERFERFVAQLQDSRPAVLLFAEGTSPQDALAALAARTLGIPTVRIQNGRAGVLHCGYRNMPFDVMLCWGEGFVERYRTTSPAPRYIVTGNPFIDHAATARPADAPPTVALFTQPVCATISDADYGLLLDLADRLLKATPDVRILVRRHPADRDLRFVRRAGASQGRLLMADADTHTLDQVFAVAQCATGFFSTALSEAIARGVVPVMIRTGARQAVFPHPEDEGAAILVHDLDSAIARIDDVLRQRPAVQALYPAMQRFSARYFGPMDGQAIQRTVDAIRQSQKAYGHG